MGNLAYRSKRAAAISGMATGETTGYYLILPNGNFHCIGQTIEEARRNVDRACDKYLYGPDYDYYIDYSHGLDHYGRVLWSNLDHTDNII